MIVKIIRYFDNDDCNRSIVSLYECSRFEIKDSHNSSIVPLIEMETHDGCIYASLDVPNSDVYILNDEGKTIDHFKFSYISKD